MKLYNKSKRRWVFRDGEEEITVMPKSFFEVSDETAEKMTERYPDDFISGDEWQETPTRKMRHIIAENEQLKKELAELKGKKKAGRPPKKSEAEEE